MFPGGKVIVIIFKHKTFGTGSSLPDFVRDMREKMCHSKRSSEVLSVG